MNFLLDFVAQTLRSVLRLLMVAMLGALVLGILAFGLCAALLSVLWSLLRGKKPAMFTVFQTFRQASQPFRQGFQKAAPASQGDVVDVQAHEVRQALERPEGH
ncbi:hypothetical protein DIC66_17350 [Rhodoferax lacus]|uniref:Uncharacterized protein n=1 Tax=Rhodoferax lacus TaxID=2184758 RepID=A0A3E1RA78_9BURK|nr:hypothetical protein [Rhodoferax lacus]RFO95570.1 hypothetical protein DIC66_17350 [Rhodoferax lacus]